MQGDAAGRAMREREEAHAVASSRAKTELLAVRAAQEEERARIALQLNEADGARQVLEMSVVSQQALLAALKRELGEQETAAAAAAASALAEFHALRSQYEDALTRLRAGEHKLSSLRASCSSFESSLEAARKQRAEEASRLMDALAEREAELGRALADSRAKSTLLSAALGEREQLEAESERLQKQVVAAEETFAHCEQQLLALEGEMEATRVQRSQLQAEVATLQRLTADELKEAERQRLEEVGGLLRRCDEHEAQLLERRKQLRDEQSASTDALRTAQADARRALDARERRAAALQQRLQRQAVIGAATAKALDEQSEINSDLRGEHQRTEHALLRKERELESVRDMLRDTHLGHLRQLMVGGVWALKHGRKGKPHARHVRASKDLLRLEWGRSAQSSKDEKSLAVDEIVAIECGLQTEVARRSGKGKAALLLSVVTATRTLDLEFGSEEARDRWLGVLREWRAATLAGEHAPSPPSTRAQSHPPASSAALEASWAQPHRAEGAWAPRPELAFAQPVRATEHAVRPIGVVGPLAVGAAGYGGAQRADNPFAVGRADVALASRARNPFAAPASEPAALPHRATGVCGEEAVFGSIGARDGGGAAEGAWVGGGNGAGSLVWGGASNTSDPFKMRGPAAAPAPAPCWYRDQSLTAARLASSTNTNPFSVAAPATTRLTSSTNSNPFNAPHQRDLAVGIGLRDASEGGLLDASFGTGGAAGTAESTTPLAVSAAHRYGSLPPALQAELSCELSSPTLRT